MKKYLVPVAFLLAALAVVLVIVNEHVYNQKQLPPESEVPVSDVSLSGYVTSVDTSAMMVDGPAKISFLTTAGDMETIALPSMGLPLCAAKDALASIGDIAVGDSISVRGAKTEEGVVPCESAAHYLRVFKEVSEPTAGIEFKYRAAPAGYVLQRFRTGMSVDPDFLQGYILTSLADMEELASSDVPRDGAPTLQIRAYKNSTEESALDWARSHPLETNIELAFGEPRSVMIEHVPAVLFKADGLYASDVYVAAHEDFMYVLTGAYSDEGSTLLADFAELLTSVVFLEGVSAPTTSTNASGDIALALGETGMVGDVRITPKSLLEDSRCPSDVMCIQAGTVRLTASIESALGTADAEFVLGVPLTTEAEEVVLIGAAPETHSQTSIANSEYRFTFSVTSR